MRHRAILVLVLWACASGSASAQECRDPLPNAPSGTVSGDGRREAAARYLIALHGAQRRAQAESGRYISLQDLRGLPDLPVGFVPKLMADRWSYMISVTDLLDACGFALVSDDREVIHVAYPRRIPSSLEQR